MLIKFILSSLPLIVIAYFFHQWCRTGPLDSKAHKPYVIAGIMSSLDHFDQRKSLRNSWLKPQFERFQYKFLVGNDLCHIHPSDRVFSSSCEQLDILITQNTSENTEIYTNSQDLFAVDKDTKVAFGFSFFVNHKIEIKSLGILKHSAMKNTETVIHVVLEDSKTNLKTATATFKLDFFSSNLEKDGYVLKKLRNPLLLPKGFEGSVYIRGAKIKHLSCSKPAKWKHKNCITVYNINTYNGTQLVDDACILVTFGFVVKDLDDLRYHSEKRPDRARYWLSHLEDISKKLKLENEKYQDLLILNVMDIYHNLPLKTLQFLKWLFKNYNVEYILKTDDDTFIDLSAVLKEVEMSSGWDIWSCFRHQWPAHRHGRHREQLFRGDVYPVFPSGAGYVLSTRAIQWLQSRIDVLETGYAGEDVAMGIWLEGMNPRTHFGTVCHWACNEHCHRKTCNVMQLSTEEMSSVFTYYKQCGNKICVCPARDGT